MSPKTRFNAGLLAAALVATTASAADRAPRIANEGTIGQWWALADGAQMVPPVYPAGLVERGDDVCIALGYLIGEDGATSQFAVLRVWNSESGEKEPAKDFWKAFATAGGNAVSQWRFKPRPDAGVVRPTYSVVTLGFQGKGRTPADKLQARCRIDDLQTHITRMRYKPFERGDMNKQMMEHDRINDHQQDLEEIMRRANGS